MSDSKWYLVCYDIRDPKRLRKVAKTCAGYGERLQYSVFRLWLDSRQIQQLRWELTELLDPADDVIFIPLCSRCVAGVQTTHSAARETDWPDEPKGHLIV